MSSVKTKQAKKVFFDLQLALVDRQKRNSMQLETDFCFLCRVTKQNHDTS